MSAGVRLSCTPGTTSRATVRELAADSANRTGWPDAERSSRPSGKLPPWAAREARIVTDGSRWLICASAAGAARATWGGWDDP